MPAAVAARPCVIPNFKFDQGKKTPPPPSGFSREPCLRATIFMEGAEGGGDRRYVGYGVSPAVCAETQRACRVREGKVSACDDVHLCLLPARRDCSGIFCIDPSGTKRLL